MFIGAWEALFRKRASLIDPEKLINSIAEKVTDNLLKAMKGKPETFKTAYTTTKELLTVKEAAQFLNLSTSTIYGKVHRNELPYMKRGKRLYFSSTELLQYLKKGRVKTCEEREIEMNKYLAK